MKRRWSLDLRTGKVTRPHDAVGYHLSGGSWSPDADTYVAAAGGVVRVFDPATGEVSRRNKPAGDHVAWVDYGTDGSRMASAEIDGTVTLRDGKTLAPVGRPVRLPRGARFVTLGPDNHTALVAGDVRGSGDTTTWLEMPTSWSLVDLKAGAVIRTEPAGFPIIHADFSPDGRHAALSGGTGRSWSST